MKKLLKVGLDWDDTLCPFVKHAVTLCNTEKGTNIAVTDITEWGNNTDVTKMVSPYYSDIRSYQRQAVSERIKELVKKLMTVADVYIVTAVPPQFMSIRAEQITREFPDFPGDHILMGAAKSLVKLDILLDDAPHNILKSSAVYPVLMRRPWNLNLSGVLSVNNMDEFLVLVNQIICQMTETEKVKEPCVYAIVGPSGAAKHTVANKIIASKDGTCQLITSIELDSPDSVKPDYSITDTTYAGRRYTLDGSQLASILNAGSSVVAVVDICGAIALKHSFPTIIIFCRQNRMSMIRNVLNDFRNEDVDFNQASMQLLSMEQELKNEALCDFSVRSDDDNSIKTLLNQL